jgi:hypothetical protein
VNAPFRKYPSIHSNIITVLSNSQKFVVYDEKCNWYKIENRPNIFREEDPDGIIGWIEKKYLKPYATGYFEIIEDVEVRKEPSNNSEEVDDLDEGDFVWLIKKRAIWYLVRYKGNWVWVESRFCKTIGKRIYRRKMKWLKR